MEYNVDSSTLLIKIEKRAATSPARPEGYAGEHDKTYYGI
jgi:hypothetical protein